MEFKKCERCGCFFASTSNICDNCIAKDNMDISKLKNYFENNDNVPNFGTIISETGISEKNLNRYLQNNDFIENQNRVFDLN